MDNKGQHIEDLMMRSACEKHRALVGEPCWYIPVGHIFSGDLRAICGKRVRRGGFNGKISPTSLALKKNSNKKEVNV